MHMVCSPAVTHGQQNMKSLERGYTWSKQRKPDDGVKQRTSSSRPRAFETSTAFDSHPSARCTLHDYSNFAMSTFRPASPPRPSADDDASVLDIVAPDTTHDARPSDEAPLHSEHPRPHSTAETARDGPDEPPSFVPAITPDPCSTAGNVESPAEELVLEVLDGNGDPGPSTIAARAIHVEPGQLSPQPWDLIPPPAHNNLHGTYSTAVTRGLNGVGVDLGDDRTS